MKAKDLKAKGLKIFCNFLISLLIIHTFLQNLGKKVDTWFSVDRFTGSKQGSLTFNGCLKNEEDTCPNLGPSNFLVGRTEYNIMMYDSRAPGRKWNISYYDYSSNRATEESQSEYSEFTDR